MAFEPDDTDTSAAHCRPATSAARPLTLTPRSAPPPSTVPRTITTPIGTVVPVVGSLMAKAGLAVPTVKARRAGVGSSLPARSRARTSKTCGPGASMVSVTELSEPKLLQAPSSTRQAN